MTDPSADLAAVVARAIDRAALGGSTPSLLLEVQARVGLLSARSNQLTERGVRPFRPDEEWGRDLGELAFAVYHLADQTGVELEREIRVVAAEFGDEQPGSAPDPGVGWPFSEQ